MRPEDAGANCAYGGQRMDLWVDLNDNGILDTGVETGETAFICTPAPAVGGTSSNGCCSVVRTEASAHEPAWVLLLIGGVWAIRRRRR